MNGDEASPSVTAGGRLRPWWESRAEATSRARRAVMSAAEDGPEVSLGTMDDHLPHLRGNKWRKDLLYKLTTRKTSTGYYKSLKTLQRTSLSQCVNVITCLLLSTLRLVTSPGLFWVFFLFCFLKTLICQVWSSYDTLLLFGSLLKPNTSLLDLLPLLRTHIHLSKVKLTLFRLGANGTVNSSSSSSTSQPQRKLQVNGNR